MPGDFVTQGRREAEFCVPKACFLQIAVVQEVTVTASNEDLQWYMRLAPVHLFCRNGYLAQAKCNAHPCGTLILTRMHFAGSQPVPISHQVTWYHTLKASNPFSDVQKQLPEQHVQIPHLDA